MLHRIIEWSLENQLIVIVALVLAVLGGVCPLHRGRLLPTRRTGLRPGAKMAHWQKQHMRRLTKQDIEAGGEVECCTWVAHISPRKGNWK